MPNSPAKAVVQVSTIQATPRQGFALRLQTSALWWLHLEVEWSGEVLLLRVIDTPQPLELRVESGLGCDYTVETDKDGAS